MRDNYIQHDPLDTAQFPNATFAPTAVSGMPWPLPASGSAKFALAGDFTVRGTTKPVTWAVTATFTPNKVTGSATTPFTFSEFGMQAPHTMIALSVQDNGAWTMQFTATRASA
jgi:polyisoprenoid-binding protein YceI